MADEAGAGGRVNKKHILASEIWEAYLLRGLYLQYLITR